MFAPPCSHQIGGVVRGKGMYSDTDTYTITYFAIDSELSSYIPKIGDAAPWASEAAFISSVRVRKSDHYPSCWLVSIRALPTSCLTEYLKHVTPTNKQFRHGKRLESGYYKCHSPSRFEDLLFPMLLAALAVSFAILIIIMADK